MRYSHLFGKTLREAPAEAESLSAQLLTRAGLISQLASGLYTFLPLGWRVLRRISDIIRQEMDMAGGQEVMLPFLQPWELWEKTGRCLAFGETLFTLKDRRDRTLVLGPTHEEIITDLVHRFSPSYRELPLLLYQIQVKFRDEPRPRGGLLRVREFIMKDLYSFDDTEAGLDRTYDRMIQAYGSVYSRCGLEAILVEADSGAIGGKASHEFMALLESGEDRVIRCPACGYAANLEKAHSVKPEGKVATPLPAEEIATPGIKTIEEVARFVGVSASETLKAVFYTADGQFVFVAIRGDLDVNETKLRNLLKCTDLRLATEAEVRAAGVIAGSASPVGFTSSGKVVADDSITMGGNFVAGANKPDTHLKNVNYPRDFKVDVMADIAQATPGDRCTSCGGALGIVQGIEVGHVFKLGTFLSEKLAAYFKARDDTRQVLVMGCYGIGVGRILAAVVEQHHDDKGIIWPSTLAPYQVHLCSLYAGNPEVVKEAEALYGELQKRNIEALFDDRDESPGVKFADADLLGIPLRVVLSPRTLQARNVEVKWRQDKKAQLIPLDGAAARIVQMLAEPPSLQPEKRTEIPSTNL